MAATLKAIRARPVSNAVSISVWVNMLSSPSRCGPLCAALGCTVPTLHIECKGSHCVGCHKTCRLYRTVTLRSATAINYRLQAVGYIMSLHGSCDH